MFSNIDEQIQQSNGQPISRVQRLLRALGVFGVTTILFGSLYLVRRVRHGRGSTGSPSRLPELQLLDNP